MGSYSFINIEKCGAGAQDELYFQDGTFYCTDCLDWYLLPTAIEDQIWECDNCPEDPINSSDIPVFTDHPWLSNLVSLNNCELGESVKLYEYSEFFSFLVVETANGVATYLDDGSLYCSYDCHAALGLSNVLDSWECDDDNNDNPNPTTDIDTAIEEYEWLEDIVDTKSCIKKYDFGGYSFIYIVDDSNQGSLYLDNGTFYCAETPAYSSCYDTYIGSKGYAQSWNCSNDEIPNGLLQTNTGKSATVDTSSGLLAYPNPTRGTVTVQVQGTPNTEQQMFVHDLFGRTLESQTIPASKQLEYLELDLSNYAKGSYYIELRSEGERKLERIIKQD